MPSDGNRLYDIAALHVETSLSGESAGTQQCDKTKGGEALTGRQCRGADSQNHAPRAEGPGKQRAPCVSPTLSGPSLRP